jgi:CheY-like chemotaxis protein
VELLRRAFRDIPGLDLEVAYHGREAVDQIMAQSERGCWPDLVVCDLNMPEMNGFEFLKWLKKESPCPRTPAVVLTSSAVEGDLAQAYDIGAAAYLVKPSSHKELQIVAKALAEFWKLVHSPPLRREK